METTPGPVRDNDYGASTREAAEVVELDRAETMRLLATVGYGRVVFSQFTEHAATYTDEDE